MERHAISCGYVIKVNSLMLLNNFKGEFLNLSLIFFFRADPLLEEPGWARNGAGRQFSHKFGYGLMDASQVSIIFLNYLYSDSTLLSSKTRAGFEKSNSQLTKSGIHLYFRWSNWQQHGKLYPPNISARQT